MGSFPQVTWTGSKEMAWGQRPFVGLDFLDLGQCHFIDTAPVPNAKFPGSTRAGTQKPCLLGAHRPQDSVMLAGEWENVQNPRTTPPGVACTAWGQKEKV